MTDFVLDNSVTMRWCFDRGSHPYADSVLRRLGAASTAQERAFVPILWRYEVSSVLVKALKATVLLAHDATGFFNDLASLPITVDAQSGDRILTDVHQLAVTYGLTSYDAAYLELALRKNLPLASLDEELKQACLNAGGTLL